MVETLTLHPYFTNNRAPLSTWLILPCFCELYVGVWTVLLCVK